MKPRYYGDTGLFRLALEEAGFRGDGVSIFNDDSKAKPKAPTRRLKLWWATAIFKAPQEKQKKLERILRELFEDRILVMYFVQNSTPYGRAGEKSLCIKLRDNV